MTEVAENTSEETQVASETVSEFDGNLGEGWMEKYGVSEDLRSNQTLLTTKDVAGMASQLVNAQKMIGQNPNMAVIPTEQSSETEWSEFHKATGRPDTPDEYQIAHPEGVEVNAELETSFKGLVHSEGLRPSTVQKLSDFYENTIAGMRQAMVDSQVQAKTDCEEALKSKWGAAYDERLHLTNRMVAENATDENKDHVLASIGNDPVVADFLANMAAKFVEHRIITADINQPTPPDALAAAETLRNTPGYINGELANTSPARYKQITKEISALMEQAYPEPK